MITRIILLTMLILTLNVLMISIVGLIAFNDNRILLQGSGATFPLFQIESWIGDFMEENRDVIIQYVGKGSGAGLSDLFNGLVDFAFSDPPLKRELWLKYKGEILQVPCIAGAIAIIYNIPELPKDYNLRLTGKVLAEIYLGRIRFWDDNKIKQLNPEIADLLPHREIIVVHRSDSSGTTEIFTRFLSLRSKEWAERVGYGKVVDWPIDKTGRGRGGKGNYGVAQIVSLTSYSIGYVELFYAKKLDNVGIAMINNRAGLFILPSKDSIMEALRNALNKLPNSPLDDWSKDLDAFIDAPGEGSYPLVTVSHIILWRTYSDKAKLKALRLWLEWILTKGQDRILDGYAPIPYELRIVGLKALTLMEYGDSDA